MDPSQNELFSSPMQPHPDASQKDTDPGQSDTPHSESDGSQSLPLVAGQRLGPYRLVRELGHGGMGQVWLAEQSQPVQREIALKIVRPTRPSGNLQARFLVERQALAVLNHPNIARILDAGTTQDGRPYFAMELIDGSTITRYCDQN